MKNTCKYLDSLNKYCHKPHQCCSIILHQAIKRETTGRLHIEIFFNVFVLLIWKSYQKFKRLPPVKTICFTNGMYIKICFFSIICKKIRNTNNKNYFVLFLISNQHFLSWFDKDRWERIFDILSTDRTTLLALGTILATGSIATGYENYAPFLSFANPTRQNIFQTFVFPQVDFCNDWKH